MPDIRHRVGIAAPAQRVYSTLATEDGLTDFWTDHIDGHSEVGGKLSFYFGFPEPAAEMEVVELVPGERVRWRCVEGPAEWVDTTITFDLKDTDDETVVLFTHADWPAPAEFMHHCSTKWATFLLGLRSGLEGGTSTAYPNDVAISHSWR
jgi:uncharacterized protein YndB with AHSA1/START domain